MTDYRGPTAPANPVSGETWLDTDADVVKVYDGTAWRDITDHEARHELGGADQLNEWLQVKRDLGGSVQFAVITPSLATTGITSAATKTVTIAPSGQAFFIKAIGTLGTGVDTPAVSLKINGANTKTSSVAATNTTLNFTTTWTTTVSTPSLTAIGSVAGGTGTLTVTWNRDARTTVVPR